MRGLRSDFEKFRAVGRDGCRKPVGTAEIFLPPEIADSLAAGELELRHVERDDHRLLAVVEQPDSPTVISQRLGPNLGVSVLADGASLPGRQRLDRRQALRRS